MLTADTLLFIMKTRKTVIMMAPPMLAIAAIIAVCSVPGTVGIGYAQEMTPATSAQGNAAVADTDESRIAELITAYRICVNEGVLDSFGHISVRSVKNPTTSTCRAHQRRL